jgi:hypothetical protein
MISGCYAFEVFPKIVDEQPHYLLFVNYVGHIAVDEADVSTGFSLRESELFGVFFHDAHLPIVVHDVEMGSR